MKVKVVLKDVGARENGARMWVTGEYSLTFFIIKLCKKCLWVGGSCWGGSTKFILAIKT